MLKIVCVNYARFPKSGHICMCACMCTCFAWACLYMCMCVLIRLTAQNFLELCAVDILYLSTFIDFILVSCPLHCEQY